MDIMVQIGGVWYGRDWRPGMVWWPSFLPWCGLHLATTNIDPSVVRQNTRWRWSQPAADKVGTCWGSAEVIGGFGGAMVGVDGGVETCSCSKAFACSAAASVAQTTLVQHCATTSPTPSALHTITCNIVTISICNSRDISSSFWISENENHFRDSQGMPVEMEEGEDEVVNRLLFENNSIVQIIHFLSRLPSVFIHHQIPLEEMPFQKKKPHKHISMGLCRCSWSLSLPSLSTTHAICHHRQHQHQYHDNL